MKTISIDNIRKVRIFQDLTDDELLQILPLLKTMTVLKGQYIIREQTSGNEIYILSKGTVRVTKELIKGIEAQEAGEKQLATITSESLPSFGENGLLGKNIRSANVIALTDCELLTLSQEDFNSFAEVYPRIAYIIMKNIATIQSERLIQTDENLVKLATALFISVSR